jgi:hypothetical protein
MYADLLSVAVGWCTQAVGWWLLPDPTPPHPNTHTHRMGSQAKTLWQKCIQHLGTCAQAADNDPQLAAASNAALAAQLEIRELIVPAKVWKRLVNDSQVCVAV